MKPVLTILALMIVSSVGAGEPAPQMPVVGKVHVQPDHRYPWYFERFPFMTYKDTVFSAESEFLWPEGYRRPDSTTLSGFQLWASYLPLWHRQRQLRSFFSGKIYNADQISRPIHFPRWRTQFSDKTIALELWAQYMVVKKRQFDFTIQPVSGKPLVYDDYLSGSLALNSRDEVIYLPAPKRDSSQDEFSAFVELCDRQSTYQTLAGNCDSMAVDKLLPGDMYITWTGEGYKGKVVYLLTMVVDSLGHKLFTVGLGCPEECEFYIPLLNGDRNYPWISADQIPILYPSQGSSGFYRPRIK